jgi:hypothetical protein
MFYIELTLIYYVFLEKKPEKSDYKTFLGL